MNETQQLPPLEADWRKLLPPHPAFAKPSEQLDDRDYEAYLERAAKIRDRLNEPDRTILDLSLHGLTHQQIGNVVNRSRTCVTGRLRKIEALIEKMDG